jgi:hypothetical protein
VTTTAVSCPRFESRTQGANRMQPDGGRRQLVAAGGRRPVLVKDFLYGGFEAQQREKTRAEVSLMRDRLVRVEASSRAAREKEAIKSSDVENMLGNLDTVKANSRRFLTSQASKALREETARTHQTNAAKLFEAASAGDSDACVEILRRERDALTRLARMEGQPEGQTRTSALVNAVDVDGRRPLHYAACHGVARVVSLLLGAGADESAVDSDGYSALHYACRWNQPDAVDILAWHVDVNATDSWGQTALHVAAASEGSQLVNVLVMRGARVAQQDNDGRTATDVATLHCDEAFKNAVRLATDEAAALTFGPGEFDIVNEMSSLTDELSLTQQIVAELYDLGDATAEQLDGMVAQLEVFGADGAAAEARLGKSGPVGMGEFEALKLRLATDLELFKSSPAPNYAGAAATIVPGRDGPGTS